CSLLQLKHNVPQPSLYTERYGYKSGMNSTMRKELKEIVDKTLDKLGQKDDIAVVDIGANDGTLLSNYSDKVFKVGIEPIKKFARECKLKAEVVINDFFNYKSYFRKMKTKKAHIITVISCFYDVEKPNLFLSDVKKILHEDGILVIQQNYLVGMLKKNAYDNIVHEHLEYYSLLSLEKLLKRHGFCVFDVEEGEVNGGSFRTYISNIGKRKMSKSVINMRAKEEKINLNNKKIYMNFAQRVEVNKNKLSKLISKLIKRNKKIYIYGASTRGNTLLQYCGLDNKLIKAAVERNSEKWGKKIASVGIPIISEEQARTEKPDYMLVLPWFFKEEFLRREKKYLQGGGHFIFPLPNLEVI
ncbi:MAG: class I SAM-dependent methyltransferase, partial [Candidatus Levybacteria bacterium]|nr:class I SAM-dependent methyltransferase [Candidatus Levybacteria bacterium]